MGEAQRLPSTANQGVQIDTAGLANGSNAILINEPSGWTGNAIKANLNGVEQWAITHAGAAWFNGNVGIGTASPSYLLHVNGTAYASGAAGALSDVRHKKNVETLQDGALGIIASLRPVTFEWKKPADDGMKGQQLGFIAQEVEKILPSIVLTQQDNDRTKGLKPTEMLPVIVKAMQELKALVEASLHGHEAQIKALQDDLRSLHGEFRAYQSAHP